MKLVECRSIERKWENREITENNKKIIKEKREENLYWFGAVMLSLVSIIRKASGLYVLT